MPNLRCQGCALIRYFAPGSYGARIICQGCRDRIRGRAIVGGPITMTWEKGKGVKSVIRFYRTFVEQVLFALIYVKDTGRDTRGLYQYARDYWSERGSGANPLKTEELCSLVRNLVDQDRDEDQSLDDMIILLGEQLRGSGGEDQDHTLIDSIVEVLKLPYAQNVLGGSTLNSLRKAILIPDELAGLRARLEERELHCSGCGHHFATGEMCTINRGNERGRDTMVYCTMCSTPTIAPCHSCKAPQSIPKGILKAFQKLWTCSTCEQKKRNGIDPTAPTPTVNVEDGSRIDFGGSPTLRSASEDLWSGESRIEIPPPPPLTYRSVQWDSRVPDSQPSATVRQSGPFTWTTSQGVTTGRPQGSPVPTPSLESLEAEYQRLMAQRRGFARAFFGDSPAQNSPIDNIGLRDPIMESEQQEREDDREPE